MLLVDKNVLIIVSTNDYSTKFAVGADDKTAVAIHHATAVFHSQAR